MVQFADHLTLDAPTRTRDGYMAVRAKAARVGTYQYLGSEIDPENKHGLRDAGLVNVLRDEAAVFDAKSAHSFIGKPITDNHPSVAVNAANWRDHARGVVMGAMRDKDHLAFDLMLTDAATIDAVEKGKRELSNGYEAELQFGDFDGPGGVKCVAKQVAIKGNHVAIVDKGRAGPSCAITDSVAVCDANPAALADLTPRETPTMKIKIGDAEVDATNGEAVRIAVDGLNTKLTALDKRATDAETQVATLTTDKATLDAKVTTLEKQVADAKLTPAQLRDAAKAYAQVCDKAQALGITVTDDMDEPAIMQAAVAAKIGDAAKGWNDTQIAASFATLTADIKPAVKPIGAPQMQDATGAEAKALNDSISNLNAWRDQRPAAAA